jgi:hypothetical protein
LKRFIERDKEVDQKVDKKVDKEPRKQRLRSQGSIGLCTIMTMKYDGSAIKITITLSELIRIEVAKRETR